MKSMLSWRIPLWSVLVLSVVLLGIHFHWTRALREQWLEGESLRAREAAEKIRALEERLLGK